MKINAYTIILIIGSALHYGLSQQTSDLSIPLIAVGLAGINQALWSICHILGSGQFGSTKVDTNLPSEPNFWRTFIS